MTRYFSLITLLFILSQCKPASSPQAPAGGPPLPSMKMQLLDGSILSTDDLSGKMVLVIFSPDCDHCQREAKQIREHLREFQDYQVYFASSYELKQLADFAKTYELDVPNFHFGRMDPQYVINFYGYIDLPSLYIYSDEKKLVKQFVGETPIETILKYL